MRCHVHNPENANVSSCHKYVYEKHAIAIRLVYHINKTLYTFQFKKCNRRNLNVNFCNIILVLILGPKPSLSTQLA